MTKYSKDFITDYILKSIGEEMVHNLDEYCHLLEGKECHAFSNQDEVLEYFKGSIDYFRQNASYSETEDLKYYTGYVFTNINALLRGTWNYERNGLVSDDIKKEYYAVAERIRKTIARCGINTGRIKVYRGVNLNAFLRYGISSISDLVNLKGQFLYDSGFTSTSLLRDKSFFDRDLEWHENCNVEMEILLPDECDDAIPLIIDEISYSTNQAELLINSGGLFKVLDVEIFDDGKKATLKVAYIPKKVWDLSVERNNSLEERK